MNDQPIQGRLYCFDPVHKEDIVWLQDSSKCANILILGKECDDVFLLTKIENESWCKTFRTFYFLQNSKSYRLPNISNKTFKLYFKEIKNEI